MKKESIRTYSYRISQASRTELIVIMYDMAMEYIDDAVTALREDDQPEFEKGIRQTKRIIDELSTCLDMKYDISQELLGLYMFASRILVAALAQRTDKDLDRLRGMIERLRKSFYQVSKQDSSGPMIKNSQQVYAGLTYSNVGGSNEVSSDPVSNRGYIV